MNDLIEKIGEYKNAIKNAIIVKYKEINSDESEINPGDNLFEYASIIKQYLSLEFEEKFKRIGYDGIPEELLLTLQGQASYIASSDTPANRVKSCLSKSLFIGTDFVGDLDGNRRCVLLFTDKLQQYRAFNDLVSLQELYVLKDPEDLTSYDEQKINTYWFFMGTRNIKHIYAILDMENHGYTLGTTEGQNSGTYFFSGGLKNGIAEAAQAPSLETLYMKNIHRAYNFSNSPLSMDSVRYCINHALYDADYAADENALNYKFTLKGSAYTNDQKIEIAQAVVDRAAELSETGLNMEIVFA